MGKIPVPPATASRVTAFDVVKALGGATGIVAIVLTLLSVGRSLEREQAEVRACTETSAKILYIYQQREDAGRAALQFEIDAIKMELENPKPARRRQLLQERLTALQHKLDSSKANEIPNFAHGGGGNLPGVSQ